MASATRLTVTYAISQPFRSHTSLPTKCVPGAHCFDHKWRQASPQVWERMARQTLTCSPAGGTYPDPAKACAALADFYHRARKPHASCSCPLSVEIGATAHGTYRHHRVTIGLGFCEACGLGPAAIHDIHVLTPHGLG